MAAAAARRQALEPCLRNGPEPPQAELGLTPDRPPTRRREVGAIAGMVAGTGPSAKRLGEIERPRARSSDVAAAGEG